ncbi:hypothetical protein L1987_31110 [Smallanthus sonchifolius]|uniref:Uncharacterized protein n=1 Tax=Smallanthus sonchifolius TaxID=185202 RepID=A0ACB9I5K9_9ASTR|nr:hypothetical protein L1987_31110 [Smallanthus sonchifolius]
MGNRMTNLAPFQALLEEVVGKIFNRLCKLFKSFNSSLCFNERFMDRVDGSNLWFFHTRESFEDIGMLLGYDRQAELKFSISLSHLSAPAILNTEIPRLLAATGNLFLFVLDPLKDALLVWNPFIREYKRLHWPFEVTDSTFRSPIHVKFIVLSPKLLHFELVCVENHFDEPVHFIYNLVTMSWMRRVATRELDDIQLDKTDHRSLFLMEDLAYLISFSNVDSDFPLYVNPPPSFYEVGWDPNIQSAFTPGWTDDRPKLANRGKRRHKHRQPRDQITEVFVSFQIEAPTGFSALSTTLPMKRGERRHILQWMAFVGWHSCTNLDWDYNQYGEQDDASEEFDSAPVVSSSGLVASADCETKSGLPPVATRRLTRHAPKAKRDLKHITTTSPEATTARLRPRLIALAPID